MRYVLDRWAGVMRLVAQPLVLGSPGLVGRAAGLLSAQEAALVQRFTPGAAAEDSSAVARHDTDNSVGFFIAKFVKTRP